MAAGKGAKKGGFGRVRVDEISPKSSRVVVTERGGEGNGTSNANSRNSTMQIRSNRS